ncbi:hypothetical protein AVEN_267543-1 [Araneus ventricosus]|uniref:Histone-lysine N-methyltransferase SETMAR n=1 Tax=Araneus ventricosus TaxID=182803 RepID=A0A4Y2U7V0_ARAVE|nr:hypothetical protein AVEN_267543-1 [Araneus ventricosus]
MAGGLEKWSHLEMRAVIRFLCAKNVSVSEGPPRKCPDMLSDGIILLHDNARLHTARKTQELLQKFTREVWSHSLNSPDLAPNLVSKRLSGARFSSDTGMKTAAENWLAGEVRHFYEARLKKLVWRSDKCIDLVIM